MAELWIKGQNNKTLTKVNALEILKIVEDNCTIYKIVNENDFSLGRYSNLEQATKILNDIELKLLHSKISDIIIYQMEKDNENTNCR